MYDLLILVASTSLIAIVGLLITFLTFRKEIKDNIKEITKEITQRT